MSREPQEVTLYNGRIDATRVKEFAQTLFTPADVTEYFVCGPGNMIDEVSGALRALGVEADKIHGEHFTLATTGGAMADGVTITGAAATDAAAEAGSAVGEAEGEISVEFAEAPTSEAAASAARAGAGKPAEPAQPEKPALAADESEVTVLMDGRRRTFTMRMNDEVVLDAAARAGLELPFSCRAGVCSTCRTKVVRGEVEMAQNYALEDWEVEQGYVLACQSRVKTPALELDYDEK
jgi:ring-1,2-phenylacetyl-CoA epoxidase subunit PaaE